ncbi:MAG: hypothetical protein OEW00_10870, partial [candidate division Zixibacteria bacterium]|nr:hypothetical protein [candidate division Zixibacteria bacterium]
ASEIELRKFFPFKGRLLKIIPERNFGLVEVRKHPQTGDWGITLSIHGEKSGVQRFPTVW